MAKLSIKPGSVDVSLIVFIQDSTSTTGSGKTALAYDTSGLVCYYVRPGAIATAMSLVTQTVTGAHANGGFVKIDDTNMPGVYRLDLHDDVVATGARSAVVMLKGATGMVPLVLEIDLNAEVNVTHVGGTAQTARDVGASVLLSPGTGTGQISLSSGQVTVGTNNDKTGYTAGISTGGIAAGSFAAGAIDAAAIATGAIDADALAASAIDLIWDEILSGHTTVGSAGKELGMVNANVLGVQGSVDGLYSGVPCTSMGSNVLTSSALDTSAVTEIVDAVWAKAMSDLGSIPAATATVLAAINFVFMLARNKLTQTSGTSTLFKDDGSTSVGTSTVSDDTTTFTRSEWS